MRPPKFSHIAEQLEHEILEGVLPPGSLLPSQSQLCGIYKVSRSCAQKALDFLHKRGLVEKRPGKGVYAKGVSQELEMGNPFRNVALVFHEGFRLVSNPQDNFGVEMLWGVEEELRLHGANCIIRKEGKDSENFATALESTGADAFVVDREFSDEQIKRLRVLGRPVAMLGRLSSLPFVSCSLPNHADCFLKTLLRLADEGKQIVGLAYTSGSYYAPDIELALERASAARPETRFVKAGVRCGLAKGEGGLAAALGRLLEGSLRPDVIMFESDWSAVKGLDILRKRGLGVPGDLGVIGCYGLEVGRQTKPSISSLGIDPREIGRRAARLLADSALRGRAPSVERVPFEFVERDSFKWAHDENASLDSKGVRKNKREERR